MLVRKPTLTSKQANLVHAKLEKAAGGPNLLI